MSLRSISKIGQRLVLALSLISTSWGSDIPAGATNGVEAMDSLVSVEWLSQHLDDPDLVVLDCTVQVIQHDDGSFGPVSGRASYEAGHIPGAGFADLMGALSDSDSKLKFAVPSVEQFANAMGALGVGDDTRVVLYDATGSMWAARVWWMLRWAGFDNAALLDGGLNAWTSAGLAVSTEQPTRSAKALTPSERPELIVDRDQVLAAINDETVNIIDSLPPASYRGEMAMYARPGHITGAVNMSASSAFDETGHYRSQDELATIFAVDPDQRTITYCGGGIAASSNAFVLTRLGVNDVAVYTNSLQEWAADPANPMETITDQDKTAH
jgi:thiosulfate/3-mercaptopyruvate sulfurtransferase